MISRISIARILMAPEVGTTICIAGWVRTRRTSKGGFSFLEINDGSCFDPLQVVVDKDLPNYQDEILQLHPGSSVSVSGMLIASPGKEQAVELQAVQVRVHGDCEVTKYPLQKQRISFEKLRENAHLRPRTNTFGAVARVRNLLSFEVHRFFQEREFLYVHTPLITASDCEGAGEMFRVTTLDPATKETGTDDFFGRPTYLTVSGQLEAETYACALGNVYTFGPTFRAENSNTSRHLAEFWMIEPEMAFVDLAGDADLAEDFLRHLFQAVLERGGRDLAFFEQRIAPGLQARLSTLAEKPFTRISYTDAITALQESGKDFDYPPEWGIDLQTEHERFLTEQVFDGPVIVLDFPTAIKPFYMRVNENQKTVAAMDVLLPGVGEIIGGSQREERPDQLLTRMNACGIKPEDYWWYMDLRRFGTVPHSGFGLGFERLVQFCSGMANIRDVIPYPRTPNHADF